MSLIAISILGLFTAGAEEFVLGGCNHKIATAGYGSDAAGHISAAMYIPGSKLRSLAGNKISKIDVGLASRINVRNVSIWVRKALDGENLAVETVERPAQGWNEISFAAPYIIETGLDGLYIGYDYENAGSSHPVSFIGNGEEYTSYLKINEGKWEDMSQKGALSIEATVTGDNLPQYDLAFVSAKVSPDISGGENSYILSGEVSNLALKDVEGFTVTVSKEGATVAEVHIDTPVARGSKTSFTAKFMSETPLKDEVELLISAVDGGEDADKTNNSLTAKVGFTKNVVVEEFTTEMCVNCPQAAKWFSGALESDPQFRTRVLPVCHHSGFFTDWLTRDCDTELLWLYDMDGQSYAPAVMFDRHSAFKKGYHGDRFEPVVAPRSQQDFEDCIKAELNEVTHAMVGLKINEMRETEEREEIDVTVTVVTDDRFNLTNPILVVYLLEDEVMGMRQQGATGTYYHHHVIRYDNGINGETLELNGDRFEKTFTVELDPFWQKEKLYFGAFVANYDTSDIKNNAIENGAVLYLVDVKEEAGLKDLHISQPARELYRYDAQGIRHEGAFSGMNIIVYSDGSVKKILIK